MVNSPANLMLPLISTSEFNTFFDEPVFILSAIVSPCLVQTGINALRAEGVKKIIRFSFCPEMRLPVAHLPDAKRLAFAAGWQLPTDTVRIGIGR
jgi:hypothetical protein